MEPQRTAPTAAPAQDPDRNVRLGSLLAEASPDALIAITPDATIVYWNQAAESILRAEMPVALVEAAARRRGFTG